MCQDLGEILDFRDTRIFLNKKQFIETEARYTIPLRRSALNARIA